MNEAQRSRDSAPARRGEGRAIVVLELRAADRAAKNSYLVAKDGVLELEL